MGKLEFNSNPRPTIGVELELALVDAKTMELSNSIRELLDLLPDSPDHCFKPELMQCLVKALSDQIDEGAYQHDCHPMMVQQNKWRACRYGNRAQLVNSYTYKVQAVPDAAAMLIDRLGGVAESLDCRDWLTRIQAMAEEPTWADRQRAIRDATGDPAEVVRRLSSQSRISPAPAAAGEG